MSGSRIRLYGSTSGYVELEAPAVADDGVLVLPAVAQGFGKVVDIKYATKTDTQVSSGVAAGASVAVSGLTIDHAPADATNKIYVVGQITGSGQQSDAALTGAITAGGTAIGVGDAAASRPSAGAGNFTGNNSYSNSAFMAAFYQPSDTSSVTFGMNLVNTNTGTQTCYINRNLNDSANANGVRTSSFLMLIEVAA